MLTGQGSYNQWHHYPTSSRSLDYFIFLERWQRVLKLQQFNTVAWCAQTLQHGGLRLGILSNLKQLSNQRTLYLEAESHRKGAVLFPLFHTHNHLFSKKGAGVRNSQQLESFNYPPCPPQDPIKKPLPHNSNFLRKQVLLHMATAGLHGICVETEVKSDRWHTQRTWRTLPLESWDELIPATRFTVLHSTISKHIFQTVFIFLLSLF